MSKIEIFKIEPKQKVTPDTEIDYCEQDKIQRRHYRKIGKHDYEEYYKYKLKTQNDIDIFVNTLTDEEIDRFFIQSHLELPPSTLQQITLICRRIVQYDNGLENKITEIERCKEYAQEIKAHYENLLLLIEQIPDEQAAETIEVLHSINYMFLRVLGDQLDYIKYPKENDNRFNQPNLEDKIKNLYDNKTLKRKHKRHVLKVHLMKKKMSKSKRIDKNFNHYL